MTSINVNLQNEIQTLTSLGLTGSQARIYLAISELDKTTINTLSSISKIDRANVYRAVKELYKLNLVEQFLTNPATFKALSMNEGLKILLEDRKRDYEENEAKVNKLLEKYKQRSNGFEERETCQFTLVPGERFTFRKLDELVDSSRICHEGILFYRDVESRRDFFAALFRKLSCKGIKIRLIFFTEKNQNPAELLAFFENYGNISIKRTETIPKTTLSIWDKKRVFATVEPMISKPMTPGLLMDNTTVVGVFQEYFNLMWRHSSKIVS
jgi:sugar-specific transcriptional regulator TrmB